MSLGQPRISSPRRLLGRYELLFRIARGGMAEVHAARMAGVGGFEKLVAIKLMLSHLAEDERFVDMFLDEGRLAVHVSSPHVVQTLDLGQAEDGTLYLVMELVRGISLAKAMRNVIRGGGQLPVDAVVELIAQAAQGLDDAHRATTPLGEPLHLVHRDVSPQNILLGADGRVRIVDFGIARAVQRTTQTRTGEMKGKFAYFAPEQTMADAPIDHRVDVFALGVVAWEALAGRRLFKADNPAAQIDKVRCMPVPLLHQLRPEVPEDVSRAVARALVRDPDGRWASAGEMAHALREAARHAGLVLPSHAHLGEMVRTWGGEQLAKLEEHLRSALSSPATQLALSDERDTSSTGSGVRSDSLPALPTQLPGGGDDALAPPSAVSPPADSTPSLPAADLHLDPPRIESATSPRKRRAPWRLVAVALGLTGLLVTALWALRPTPHGEAPTSEPSRNPAASGTSSVPSAASPEPAERLEGSVPSAAPSVPPETRPEPEGEPRPSSPPSTRRSPTGRASPRMRRPARAAPSLADIQARAAAAAARAPAPTDSAPSPTRPEPPASSPSTSPPRTAGPRPTPPRSKRRAPSKPRRGPDLADVDDFERELGL